MSFCTNCQHEHRDFDGVMVCKERLCFCDKFEEAGVGKAEYDKYTKSMDSTFEKIEWMLRNIPAFRELNNKQFIFAFWHYEFNFCPGMVLDIPTYSRLTDPESIRRAKQKIVEKYPELAPTDQTLLIEKAIKEHSLFEWVINT